MEKAKAKVTKGQAQELGFGVPYFNTFFPKGTIMK